MPSDQNPKQLIVERIKNASNILVTVGKNPSVDELSAALGLTLFLDKIDKIATAVFSGRIPPAIEFLDPTKTFDENVDGLRDFIIALDKSKADRLRYKVEDDVVRVFITPYKTTISEQDLTFSQGDFNVDLVVALGVDKREDLDTAITAHGRILHDATTVSINQLPGDGSLGEVDWSDPEASSLCEMLIGLTEALQAGTMDQQIATALLTGLVSATDRFRNEKTSPKVMTIAAQLMAAGANQQLIADKLEEAEGLSTGKLNGAEPAAAPADNVPPEPPKPNDGEMKIGHEVAAESVAPPVAIPAPIESQPAQPEAPLAPAPQENIPFTELPPLPPQEPTRSSSWRDVPTPLVGGTLNATTEEAEEEKRREEEDSRNRVLLSHDAEASEPPVAASAPTPPVLNASSLTSEEPEVRDIFDDLSPLPAASIPAPQVAPPVMPLTPEPSPAPTPDPHTATASGISFEETPIPQTNSSPAGMTLADLEAEVQRQAEANPQQPVETPPAVSGVDDARAAVDAALAGQVFEPAGQPVVGLGAQPLGDIQHDTPNTSMQTMPPTPLPPPPALPPLPDFSTLPPLPGEFPQQPAAPSAPMFGLPEQNDMGLTSAPGVIPSGDPGQFQIPGQN
jgi:hypothetical protein